MANAPLAVGLAAVPGAGAGRVSRRGMLGATGLLGMALAAACGPAGSGARRADSVAAPAAPKGEIRWMTRAASEANRQIQLAFGPSFERQHPGTKVLAEWPTGNFQEKLTTAIAGGDPPDIAFIAASQYQSLAAQKQLANLDDYIKRDASFKKDDIQPIWLKGLQFKGQQYALPFDPSVVLLYYNRTMFDRAQVPRLDPTKPATWEDILEVARRLTIDQNGVDATRGNFDASAVRQAGITVPAYLFWWFLPRQNGQEAYAADLSQVQIDRPAARQALQWMVDVHGRFRVAIPSPVVRPTAPAAFETGTVAMRVWGLWSVPEARARLTDDWDVVPLPHFRGKARIGLGWASGNALVSTARNPDGGWHFMKFLAGPEAQAGMMEGGNVQPMLKSQANHPAYRAGSPPHSKDVPLKEADVASVPAFYPHSGELQNMILPALDGVYKGDESLDAMVARLTPLMNEKLREFKARFNY